MARSFSNAKRISSFLSDQLSVTISKRGIAAGTHGAPLMNTGGVTGAEVSSKPISRVPEFKSNQCFSFDEMANGKLISTFIVDQLSVVVVRRRIATVTQRNVYGSVRGSGVAMMKKVSEESNKSTPWVPDPVTGYYKPEGQPNQVDAADLRELLLKQKNQQY